MPPETGKHTSRVVGLSPLGIIAGGGALPCMLALQAQAEGRACAMVQVEGEAEGNAPPGIPSQKVRLGAVGQAVAFFRANGVRDIVMVGKIKRPPLASLRPDMLGVKLLAKIGAATVLGDDALLSAVVAFFEAEGFAVVGVETLLAGITAEEGVWGKIQPDEAARKDIEIGMRAAKALGAQDIGQAAVVQNGRVLALEAEDGTDALIARCADLQEPGRGAVLVKAKKPQQERRVDLPTIGVATVENCARAGFAGIAVEAGAALVVDRAATAALADAKGLFVVGVAYKE